MLKFCDQCHIQIPSEYNNLLCDACYALVSEQNTLKTAQNQEESEKTNETISSIPAEVVGHPDASGEVRKGDFGIQDPNYKENPEADDKDQILANLAQFIYSHNTAKGRKGKLLWYPQRNMYTFIKNWCKKKAMEHPQYPKQIWKPFVVDVGCGSGVGSNILSQEAHFVWGIDKNSWSIEFAQEAFTREKSAEYYSAEVRFDVFDILEEPRETQKFDVVVAIEVIEHIYDSNLFVKKLIDRFAKKDKEGNYNVPQPTEFFISSPNRNFRKLNKEHPDNVFHVREWTSQELAEFLRRYFVHVELTNQKGEPVPENTEADEVILARCSSPK